MRDCAGTSLAGARSGTIVRSTFDPNVQFNVGGVSLTGGERFATSGARSPFTTNLKDFAPRLSFAWQVLNDFVIRGGGGIYYGPSSEMVGNPALNGDGFGSSTTWNATQYNADGNTVMPELIEQSVPSGGGPTNRKLVGCGYEPGSRAEYGVSLAAHK